MGEHKVLLVEDEGLIRLLLAEGLAEAGFSVLEASTGDEALRLLVDPDHVDLVVTDIQMPGRTDGNGVAAAARALHPDIPVVYMTGNPTSLRRGLGAHDALLRKPFGPSEMVDAVRRFLPAP